MKKRILLSLVSFFMMTAMWASLIDAYQVYLTAGANGKTNGTSELTLNLKNKNAINSWVCTLVLPEGFTYVAESMTATGGRYAEGVAPVFAETVNADGTVTLSCDLPEGTTYTGTDGAIATIQVQIAATVEPADYTVGLKDIKTIEADGTIHFKDANEYVWTVEKGEDASIKGDVNGDTTVDIADGVSVLNAMAGSEATGNPDVNGDGAVDIADFVSVLNLMAGAE